MIKRKKGILLLILLVVFGACIWYYVIHQLDALTRIEPEETEIAVPRMEYSIPVDSFYSVSGIILKNEFISTLLTSLGATHSSIAQLGTLSPDTFDVKSIRAGNSYKAFYSIEDSSLCYFVYEKSPMKYAVLSLKDTLNAYTGEKEVIRKPRQVRAEIKSSLWNAAVENEIDVNVSLELSNIYAWVIDFFGLQKGDKFSVCFDELYVDSTYVGVGRIYAAEFTHANKSFNAFYFEQDGTGNYWDEKGNSLKRAFLKAPLKFSRISSHFTYARKHPVLRIVRPHTGVDYAAPTGTPVVSIGDGVVLEKGYKGGGGNTVKIRHNGTYTTAYLHLSKFGDIKVGGRVSQGQVIGYVGSTGLSTGPHLDFRVWQNNQPINPLTIESPSAEPIQEENKTAFEAVCIFYMALLNNE